MESVEMWYQNKRQYGYIQSKIGPRMEKLSHLYNYDKLATHVNTRREADAETGLQDD